MSPLRSAIVQTSRNVVREIRGKSALVQNQLIKIFNYGSGIQIQQFAEFVHTSESVPLTREDAADNDLFASDVEADKM